MTTTGIKTLTVTLPLPALLLTPNLRCHWGVRARETKAQREAAFWAAWSVARATDATRRPSPFPLRGVVRLDVTIYPRPRMRRLDDDNLWAAMKAIRDGIAEAGLVGNDSQFRIGSLTWASERRAEVELVLTEVGEA